MFRAECPRKKFPFHEIQGTAGRDLMFAWDVVNEEHGSGGTTVVGAEGLKFVPAYRRFTFAFTSPALLGVVLYTMFYDSQRFMEEFFKDDGRFTAKEANAPAHKVVKAESAMDIDRPKTRRTVFTAGEFKKKHGLVKDLHCTCMHQVYLNVIHLIEVAQHCPNLEKLSKCNPVSICLVHIVISE